MCSAWRGVGGNHYLHLGLCRFSDSYNVMYFCYVFDRFLSYSVRHVDLKVEATVTNSIHGTGMYSTRRYVVVSEQLQGRIEQRDGCGTRCGSTTHDNSLISCLQQVSIHQLLCV